MRYGTLILDLSYLSLLLLQDQGLILTPQLFKVPVGSVLLLHVVCYLR